MRLVRLMAMGAAILLVACGGETSGPGTNNGNQNNNDNQNQAACGDGTVQGEEECDDGVANSDVTPDACRTDCRRAGCGDGTVDQGEACDEGRANSDAVPDACRSDCTAPRCGDGVVDVAAGESCDHAGTPTATCGAGCQVIFCGNGILEAGELCDDGNAVGGDGCSPDCQSDESCGNGVIDAAAGEACDDGNLDPGDGCSDLCALEVCGNGVLDPGEACDDGNLVAGDGCSGDCRSDESCGNGYVDLVRGEECDDGNLDPGDGCGPTCAIEHCGNLIVDPGETCDDGNTVSGDGCSADCRSLERCGNGYVDGTTGEQCDDGNLRSGDGCSSCCTVELPNWVRATPTTPDGRGGPVMVYDAARRQMVVFGGIAPEPWGYGPRAETWLWTGGAWIRPSLAIEPEERRDFTMAYDPRRQRVVLFGGSGPPGEMNDTWEWDGYGWTKRAPADAPEPRSAMALAYEAHSGRMILFGGIEQDWWIPYDDTWAWDGVNWTKLAPADAPPARGWHGMDYDAARGRVMVYGGSYNDDHRDTWEFDGATWTDVTSDASPTHSYYAMAYDAARDQMILYDGSTPETWAWDGGGWQLLSPTASPGLRAGPGMAYDSHRGRVVVFAGQNTEPFSLGFRDDVWEWDGATWSPVPASAGPPGLRRPQAAYDGASDRVIFFGGSGSTDTWSWDGWSWSNVSPTPSPPGTGSMVYDSRRRRTLMLGSPQMWEWDGATWTETTAVQGVGGLAYDSVRDRLVRTNGAQTWEYDGAAWSHVVPMSATPLERGGHGLVYDTARGVVVMFAGGQWGLKYADTWEWDGTDWVETTPGRSPVARTAFGMAYDERRGRVILFGGDAGNLFGPVSLGDTWEYDGSSWVEIRTPTSPGLRYDHALAYDRARGEMVLYGSANQNTDTWIYAYRSNLCSDEACAVGVDRDGDGASDCGDADCRELARCAACGDGTCGAGEWCGSCPDDCGPCSACAGGPDLRLQEVHGGVTDYVEIVNRGACAWDVAGMTLMVRLACDPGPRSFIFTTSGVVRPGETIRAVEAFDATQPGEISLGAPICDTPDGGGWVMLCDGACDLLGCGTTLDYFAKAGTSAPVDPPICADFTPAPLDVSSASTLDSAQRLDFVGGRGAGQQSDWTVGAASRD